MNIGDLVSIEDLEREHIRLVIGNTKNLGEASRVLGIDAATLYRKRKRWKLDASEGGSKNSTRPMARASSEANR